MANKSCIICEISDVNSLAYDKRVNHCNWCTVDSQTPCSCKSLINIHCNKVEDDEEEKDEKHWLYICVKCNSERSSFCMKCMTRIKYVCLDHNNDEIQSLKYCLECLNNK